MLSESLLAAVCPFVIYIPPSSLEVNKKKKNSKAFIKRLNKSYRREKTNTYSSFNILYRMCFVIFDILIIVRRIERCLYSFFVFQCRTRGVQEYRGKRKRMLQRCDRVEQKSQQRLCRAYQH